MKIVLAIVASTVLISGCAERRQEWPAYGSTTISREKYVERKDPNYQPYTRSFYSGLSYDGVCSSAFPEINERYFPIFESMKNLDGYYSGHYSYSQKPFEFDCIGYYFSLSDIRSQSEKGDYYASAYIYLHDLFSVKENICSKVNVHSVDDFLLFSKSIVDDIYIINSDVSKSCGNVESALLWARKALDLGNQEAMIKMYELNPR